MNEPEKLKREKIKEAIESVKNRNAHFNSRDICILLDLAEEYLTNSTQVKDGEFTKDSPCDGCGYDGGYSITTHWIKCPNHPKNTRTNSTPSEERIKLLELANKNANLALADKCDEFERYVKATPSKPSVEEIEKAVNTEILPFADGEWRKEHPKDGYKWDEETIKTHSKRIAQALHSKFSKPSERANPSVEEICKLLTDFRHPDAPVPWDSWKQALAKAIHGLIERGKV